MTASRVEFTCPVCRATFLGPPSLAGQADPCPKCGAEVERWPAPRRPATAEPLSLDGDESAEPDRPKPKPKRKPSGWGFRLSTPREIGITVGAIVVAVLVIFAIKAVIFAINAVTSYGDNIDYPNGEVFYAEGATREDAKRVGEWLDREGYLRQRSTARVSRCAEACLALVVDDVDVG